MGGSFWQKSIACYNKPCQNVSTTPLRQWGFQQCLPFSWITLGSKHCRHPIVVLGVVDTFGPSFERLNHLVKWK